MASVISHFEVYVDDLERAKKFYSDVFGWAYQDMGPELNDYVVVYPSGEVTDGPATSGINGGMMKRPGPAPSSDTAAPNAYVCMVTIDDIDAAMERAVAAGARIDMPVMDVPTVGRMAYIRDTEMNLVGVLQPERGM
jgi:predicted enzyme related to lactoylglutathione lyase